MLGNHLDRLDCEGLGAVLREHGDHDVADNIQLGLIGCSHVDEDILGIEGNLGALAVDDGGERADLSVRVKDNRVDGLVAKDVEVTTEMSVGLVEAHELLTVDLLGLVQGDKVDVLGWEGLVGEGALDCVEIVGTDATSQLSAFYSFCAKPASMPKLEPPHVRNQCSLSRKVLVELVLQADEGVVGVLGELDVAKDRAGSIGADLLCFLGDGEGLHLVLWDVGQLPVWCPVFPAEDV